MTPEGKVKAKVNRALYNWDHVYKFMPVQMGFGAATLDYLISVNGYFLGIETKAPGKKPTDRQLQTMAQIVAAGGTVLVIDGDLKELNAFMASSVGAASPLFIAEKIFASFLLRDSKSARSTAGFDGTMPK